MAGGLDVPHVRSLPAATAILGGPDSDGQTAPRGEVHVLLLLFHGEDKDEAGPSYVPGHDRHDEDDEHRTASRS